LVAPLGRSVDISIAGDHAACACEQQATDGAPLIGVFPLNGMSEM
jgi:hypothetical protein